MAYQYGLLVIELRVMYRLMNPNKGGAARRVGSETETPPFICSESPAAPSVWIICHTDYDVILSIYRAQDLINHCCLHSGACSPAPFPLRSTDRSIESFREPRFSPSSKGLFTAPPDRTLSCGIEAQANCMCFRRSPSASSYDHLIPLASSPNGH
jgi:hypothetical protein